MMKRVCEALDYSMRCDCPRNTEETCSHCLTLHIELPAGSKCWFTSTNVRFYMWFKLALRFKYLSVPEWSRAKDDVMAWLADIEAVIRHESKYVVVEAINSNETASAEYVKMVLSLQHYVQTRVPGFSTDDPSPDHLNQAFAELHGGLGESWHMCFQRAARLFATCWIVADVNVLFSTFAQIQQLYRKNNSYLPAKQVWDELQISVANGMLWDPKTEIIKGPLHATQVWPFSNVGISLHQFGDYCDDVFSFDFGARTDRGARAWFKDFPDASDFIGLFMFGKLETNPSENPSVFSEAYLLQSPHVRNNQTVIGSIESVGFILNGTSAMFSANDRCRAGYEMVGKSEEYVIRWFHDSDKEVCLGSRIIDLQSGYYARKCYLVRAPADAEVRQIQYRTKMEPAGKSIRASMMEVPVSVSGVFRIKLASVDRTDLFYSSCETKREFVVEEYVHREEADFTQVDAPRVMVLRHGPQQSNSKSLLMRGDFGFGQLCDFFALPNKQQKTMLHVLQRKYIQVCLHQLANVATEHEFVRGEITMDLSRNYDLVQTYGLISPSHSKIAQVRNQRTPSIRAVAPNDSGTAAMSMELLSNKFRDMGVVGREKRRQSHLLETRIPT